MRKVPPLSHFDRVMICAGLLTITGGLVRDPSILPWLGLALVSFGAGRISGSLRKGGHDANPPARSILRHWSAFAVYLALPSKAAQWRIDELDTEYSAMIKPTFGTVGAE